MFRSLHQPESPIGTVYWFCRAGAGPASLVRSARSIDVPVRVEVGMLPGREDRYAEGLTLSLDEIVDQFFHAMRDRIDGPFVLVGHSLGSLLCYLLAQRLVDVELAPKSLIVMTLASPDRVGNIPRMSESSDQEFLDYLDQRFGGVPEALRRSEEALNLFLPIVRYDMRLLESYQHKPQDPLPLPIMAIGGTDDGAVSRADIAGWNEMTSKQFALRFMSGDHFFPVQSVARLIRTAAQSIVQHG